MFKIQVIFVMGLLLAAHIVSADTLEVQLPQLVGAYSINGVQSRIAPFRLDRIPTAIYRVSIRISGAVNLGQYECWFGIEPTPGPPDLDGVWFGAELPDTVSGNSWVGDADSAEDGPFEHTMVFRQLYGMPVTWEFLKGGYGEIQLMATPSNMFLECSATVWPSATVAEAVLIVEGDFAVGVEETTWGSIKSLFR
jgi:hypothetical protein